jgi:hypothetical protein
VSPARYQECIKHRWRWKYSNSGKARGAHRTKKKYLARNRHRGPSRASRIQENLFLHTFILVELMGISRPSPNHIIDHRDGDEHNCRDENLRWVTKRFNRKNLNGSHASEEHDEC